MILYKYLSPENALKVLRNRKLRFTPPSKLNDPFEMRPSYESLSESPEIQEQMGDENLSEAMGELINTQLDQLPQAFFDIVPRDLYQNIFSSLAPMTQEIAPSLFDGITDVVRESVYSTLDQSVGVLCLAERNDNMLMWSHYADSHQGVVLGFDSECDFFERRLNENDDFRHLAKISYAADSRVQITRIEDYRQELLYTKNPEWEYEQEWRMVIPLQDADEILQTEDGPVHLFAFPIEALQEIVFGYKTSDEVRAGLLACSDQEPEFSHVKKFATELDLVARRVNVIEIV